MLRHSWPVSEKKAIKKLVDEGKNAKQIKKALYSSDRSVKETSIYKVMQRLRDTPEWVDYQPRKMNASTKKVVKSARKSSKKNHVWTSNEKRGIQSLIQQGHNARSIKKELFKNDKTVSVKTLYPVIFRIKNDPNWVEQPERRNTNSREPSQELLNKLFSGGKKVMPNIKTLQELNRRIQGLKSNSKNIYSALQSTSDNDFQFDKSYQEFTTYKNDVFRLNNAISDVFKKNSKLFTPDQQLRLQNALLEQSKLIIQEKQNFLLKKAFG